MLETILEIGTSGLFGGILGVIGNFVTRREERKTLELTFKNQERMAEITAANKREEIKLEGEMKEKEVDAESFFMSQKYGNTKTGWGGAILSIVRPLLTVYLCAITTYIGYEATRIVGGIDALPANEVLAIYKEIISTALMLTTMSVSWWFGARSSHNKKPLL